MKLKQVALTFFTTVIVTTASFAHVQSGKNENYKIYVYKDCQKVDEIPMNASQINAYKALNSQELLIEKLEQPLEDMENQLEHYEDELNNLSDLMFESSDEIVVNKVALKKQKALAEKVKGIVNFYEKDINNIKKQAKLINAAARKFESVIQPSLRAYKDQDVTINIGDAEKNWQCKS